MLGARKVCDGKGGTPEVPLEGPEMHYFLSVEVFCLLGYRMVPITEEVVFIN